MALSTIGTNSVADSAVTSAKISDGTIATGDLANDAVTGAKVADLDALTVSGDLTILEHDYSIKERQWVLFLLISCC